MTSSLEGFLCVLLQIHVSFEMLSDASPQHEPNILFK